MANMSFNFPTRDTSVNALFLQPILTIICERYFVGKPTAVAHNGNQPALLDAVLSSLPVPAVISSRNDNVVASSLAVHLIALGGAVWQPAWRPRERMLVVTDRNNSDHVRDWLTALWTTSRFFNVAVMVIGEQSVQFFTGFPFKSNCGLRIQPELMDFDHLFPSKFDGDLNGCEIRTISDWIMPYVRRGEEDHPGVEDQIYSVILKKLNGTHKDVQLDPNDRVWQLADADGNPIAAGKKMHTYQADILFGGVTYRVDMVGIIDMLLPHSMDALAWFVPPPQPIAGPLKLLLAFTTQVWVLVFAVLIVTALTLSMSSNTLLTDVTALTLNMSASPSVSNVVMIFCYIYSLHITSIYQASLFSMFSRTVMEKPIETLEDAVELNLLGRFFTHHRPLMNLTNHALWEKIFKRHEFADRQNPLTFAHTRDFLLLVQLIPVTFYIESQKVYNDFGPALLPLRERFLMNPVMFYVSKGNPIGPAVNKIIQHLVDGGLVRHWLDNFIGRIVIRQQTFHSENVKLRFYHLSGAFALLTVGLVVAVLIFLSEGCVFVFGRFLRKGQGGVIVRNRAAARRLELFHAD